MLLAWKHSCLHSLPLSSISLYPALHLLLDVLAPDVVAQTNQVAAAIFALTPWQRHLMRLAAMSFCVKGVSSGQLHPQRFD